MIGIHLVTKQSYEVMPNDLYCVISILGAFVPYSMDDSLIDSVRSLNDAWPWFHERRSFDSQSRLSLFGPSF